MATPQQPEIARSRKTPAQDPDAAASVLEAHGQPGDSGGPGGPVPPENQPGHHPATEQDKPDLDAFAAKMGIGESRPEPEPEPEPEASPVAESAPGAGTPPLAPPATYWKAAGIAGIAVIASAGVGIRRRRRSRRSTRGRRF